MSGPKPETVSFLVSGFMGAPPIDREAAESVYGSPLPEPVWHDIVAGFEKFGDTVNVLSAASRVNRNRNDPRSYPLAQKKAKKALDTALLSILDLQSDEGVVRAMCIASMERPDGADRGGELRATLEVARTALIRAAAIVYRADNPPVVRVTEEDARKALARKVLSALESKGMDARLTGWNEVKLEDEMAEADMTPAERLISALAVHTAETPSAFVRWLRGAAG